MTIRIALLVPVAAMLFAASAAGGWAATAYLTSPEDPALRAERLRKAHAKAESHVRTELADDLRDLPSMIDYEAAVHGAMAAEGTAALGRAAAELTRARDCVGFAKDGTRVFEAMRTVRRILGAVEGSDRWQTVQRAASVAPSSLDPCRDDEDRAAEKSILDLSARRPPTVAAEPLRAPRYYHVVVPKDHPPVPVVPSEEVRMPRIL